jgi:uncharacterized protein (DUF885 family)
MTHTYRLYLLMLASFLLMASCQRQASTSGEYSPEQVQEESAKANAFFELTFNEAVERSPMFQTQLGIKEDYGQWDDLSDEFARLEHDILRRNLQYLRDSINYEALDESTQLSYRIFEYQAEQELQMFPYRFYHYPVNQMFGWQSQVPAFLINFHQVSTEADARAYIERLNGVPQLFDQLITQLRMNEEHGAVLPKFLFAKVLDDSHNVITGQPFTETEKISPLMEDFQQKVNNLEGLDDDAKNALMNEARQALSHSVQPAYEKLIAFLAEQERRAPLKAGVWRFPEGGDYYDAALRRTTTTDLSAAEIHEIGLREVDRIHDEMRGIMQQVDFEGDLQEFFAFMKYDPQFYYPDTDLGRQTYLDSATAIIENMKGRLDELFLTKPEADLVVKRVEPFREKSAGKAFYTRPAPDGSRPGIYYANLYDMETMPLYEMEALAYHEGLPGHHMQLAINQELEDLPKFRRFGGFTAYIEGWGLYCEAIPKEIGLYENPYADFGRLSMEIWRACRLVVDTGIHLKKWDREQGMAYYRNNTPAAEHEIESMVDRHIVMPSQATAYKIGMLKIMELREDARQRLGDRFDLREFHDVVLTNGALPLNTLEVLVNEWVATKQGS